MDKVAVKLWLDRMLAVAAWVALLTPSKVDDSIIEFAKQAAANDAVLDLLVLLLSRFQVNKTVEIEDVVKALKTMKHVPE